LLGLLRGSTAQPLNHPSSCKVVGLQLGHLNALASQSNTLLGNVLVTLGFLLLSRAYGLGCIAKRLTKPASLGWSSKALCGGQPNRIKETVLAVVQRL
jgi:hypothetical protein